ncbi:MAG: HD domain-containing phosphohydrolase [Anaerolineales bacterium]
MEAISDILSDVNDEIDSRTCYYVLLDHITTQLGLDAVALYVRTSFGVLENIARLGFRASDKVRTFVHEAGSMAQRVIETKQVVRYNPSAANTVSESFVQFVKEEGFYDYLGFPVIENGKVLGVLELYSITPFNTTTDWKLHLKFIRSLTANTIRRKVLMEERSRTATELEVAYSETLEAWVRALEIRDQYTAGHTQRVLEMTLQLASQMGIPDEMLVHITRGVLLHDIGKLAVSDNILRKTGPLDNKEWQAMREHPQFAYKLLKPIQYLRPALDIPYCHHERWDGSGYPRGLKGDNIPFQARIFSVVDVWDALTTDRPYRKAWSKQEAAAYIESKSAKEFDPKVVSEFLELVTTDLSSTQPIPVDVSRNQR